MMRRILVIAVFLLYAPLASADAGFQFNMLGLQAPEDPNVNGMRLNLLYGKNDKVSGLDLGFAAYSEAAKQSGLTINMGISKVSGASSGGALALINIHQGTDRSVNAAFINIIKSAETGANISFVNMTEETSNVDIGGLSVSKKSGTQIGFVNFTEEITGVQIGFLNFADNGFFPVFPIFNYAKK